MLGKAIIGTTMTFIFASRPYRWAWDRKHINSMMSFGWPLLLTGVAAFGSQQADQMLVGAVFSLEMMASYTLAFSIVSLPWFIFGQVAASLVLPIMARSQDDLVRLRRQYRLCLQIAAVFAATFYLPLIAVGEQLIVLLYGDKYKGTGVFVSLLGAAFAVRFLRFAPAAAALAKGDTVNQLYTTIWRGASLPLALGVVAVGGTPIQIAACALVGEILSAMVSIFRLWRRQNVPLHDSCSAIMYLIVVISPAAALALFDLRDFTVQIAGITVIGAFLIVFVTARLFFPDVIRHVLDAVQLGIPRVRWAPRIR